MNSLPSKHQIGDKVTFRLNRECSCEARVVNVHFSQSKVRYDLSIDIDFGELDPEDKISDWTGYNVPIGSKVGSTRIYNVDSLLVY